MRTLGLLLALVLGPQERRGPIPPDEAVRTIRVPAGFRVELVAAEPMVVSPVAIAFDEDGRLYAAEMRDYPKGPHKGTIRLLEDTDGDGRMDRSTVFADDIAFPTGILPWKGGILVTSAYEVLFLKDADGDGKADVREVVLSGFGRQNAQHVVNGLQYGLDNWVYGSNGLSGGKVRDVALNHCDFRFKPDSAGFEPVSGNSQFGNTFDDWGRRFIVRHDNHIVHPVLPQAYLRRQPNLPIPAVEEGISDHGNIPRLFPISPRDAVFTTDTDSSCAVTIYRGGAFPAEYAGNAFVCEPVMNLVHRDRLVPRGASFTARRADEGAEFFASTDPWCRPVNLYSAPDGALYVVDMHRAVIEHPDYIPKEIQPRLDMNGGLDCGRIYRVAHESAPRVKRPHLRVAPTAELVGFLESPNAWWRSTAQRLLVDRADRSAVPALLEMARRSKSGLGRLHALWTLEGLGALDDESVLRALDDPEPGIREHALRLAEPRMAASDPLRHAARARVDDPDPRVRFQVALTLGPGALEDLVAIALRDADDPWTRTAVLLSAAGSPDEFLRRLRDRTTTTLDEPGTVEMVRVLAGVVGNGKDEEEALKWLQRVFFSPLPTRWQRVALGALGPLRRRGMDVWKLLEKAGVTSTAREWTHWSIVVAEDKTRDPRERVDAIELMAQFAPQEGPTDLEKLLDAKEPQEIQVAAVRALSAWPGDPASSRLLDGWAGRTGAVRREILNAMIRRPNRLALVLDRLEKGEIRPVELEPHHRSEILRHPDAAIRARAKPLLEAKGSADREEVIREIASKLPGLKGDRGRGEKVYLTNCATCHRLAGKGTKVGPDLEGAIGRDRAALLVDILDPNRAMDPSYQVYVVKTASNETFNGVVAAETPAGVTLRRAGGEESTILRRDIAEIKAWPASLMPEGIENNLKAQDFADLFEFLSRRN